MKKLQKSAVVYNAYDTNFAPQPDALDCSNVDPFEHQNLAQNRGKVSTRFSGHETTPKTIETVELFPPDRQVCERDEPCTYTSNSNREPKRINSCTGSKPITSEHYRAFIELLLGTHHRAKLKPRGSLVINPCEEDDAKARAVINQVKDRLIAQAKRNKVPIEFIGTIEKTSSSTLHANLIIYLPNNCEYLIEEQTNLPLVSSELFADKADWVRTALYFLKQRSIWSSDINAEVMKSIADRVYKALRGDLFQEMLARMARTAGTEPSDNFTSLPYEKHVPFSGHRFISTRGIKKRFNAELVKRMKSQNTMREKNNKKPKHSQKKIKQIRKSSSFRGEELKPISDKKESGCSNLPNDNEDPLPF